MVLLLLLLGAGGVFGWKFMDQMMTAYFETPSLASEQAFSGEVEQAVPIALSSIEKSCTRQHKKWGFPDGLGGAGYPEIFFENGQLMIGYWQDGDVGDVLKSLPFDWNSEEDLEWYSYSGARAALELAAQTNLLEKLNYVAFDDGQLFCLPTDEDCLVAYDSWAWSDEEGNYFVAGYQKGKNNYQDLLYLINGKLYSPARATTLNYHRANQLFDEGATGANSHRFFWGFKNGKLVIKRYLDYTYTGGRVEVAFKYWPQTWLTSTYTLETCELSL